MKYKLEEYLEISAIEERVLPNSKVPYFLLFIFDRKKAREERKIVVQYLLSRERERGLEKEARKCRELVYMGHNPRKVLRRFVRYSIEMRRS